MGQVLLSTTILAAFLGGVVALLAPCCASVMLPAFFASSFRSRSQILGMTLVFAAGVGTIILPIAVGAAILSRILFQYHFGIFSVVGLAMVAVGVATLAGSKMMLPMPSGRGGGTGIGSVYGLGVFSGAASACCAPVLAGVAALSGAASSFPAAAAVGVAYVFGMVAPLCALALVWDRRDWGASHLFSATTIQIGPGARWRLPLGTVLSGGLMMAMGVITVILAVRGPGMAPDGWQVELAAALGHWAATIQQFLSFIPGWISTLAVFTTLGALVWMALRSRRNTAGQATTAITAGPCDSCDDEHTNASTPSTTPAASGDRPDHAHERMQREEPE
ncbi:MULTISPECIES: cytochrome c biogenesis protein CcdA [Cryobacterium]|uniref:Cytochrome c biogenesis protein CcdA n=1 Tax=Cryobacterium breve TaxID=1259258 RepID=A0ABY2IYF7_9MICO|nr:MULTISPECIES: cytochrome c biogenesis protein CcdA [Cryobacterium]TFC96776.1 cytochrome c biogenesis protein CcdA [Cryobacterium sp. TmT3-12]TFC97427.1 cytochrome c biogenesis protein CcdA [Cryobacterium breve]